MPAKKTNKSSKKVPVEKSKNFFFRYVSGQKSIVLVGFAIVLIAFGFFVNNKLQAQQEKDDLLAKQQKLEQIADKISELNKPNKRVNDDYCRYQSGKYEKGDLYCHIGVQLTYVDISYEQANEIMLSSSNRVVREPLENPYKSGSVTFPKIYDPRSDHISQNLTDIGSGCSVSYNYPTPLSDSRNMEIFIGCTGRANYEHFPLKK